MPDRLLVHFGRLPLAPLEGDDAAGGTAAGLPWGHEVLGVVERDVLPALFASSWNGVDRLDFRPITVGPPEDTITKLFSELVQEGGTEEWEIVNPLLDAHPIHLHLVQFQVVNREDFNVDAYMAAYNAAFPDGSVIPDFGPPLWYNPTTTSGGKYGGNPDVADFLKPPAQCPADYESGWKDTVIATPNQVTRIVVRWAPTSLPTSAPQEALFYPFDPSNDRGYVWHCHILEHEDKRHDAALRGGAEHQGAPPREQTPRGRSAVLTA